MGDFDISVLMYIHHGNDPRKPIWCKYYIQSSEVFVKS